MEQEFYRLNLVVELHDRMKAALESSRGRVKQMEDQLGRARKAAQMLDQQKVGVKADLIDHITAKASRIGVYLRGLTGRTWKVTVGIVDRVTSSIGRIVRAVTSPLGLLGLGVGGAALGAGLVGIPLRMAGEMEQAQIGFTTMLGSAEKAKQFMAELTSFAAKTPFEFPQLRDASSLLLAFKFQAEDIIPMMTAIGNAAAGLGKGPEGIERMVIALGQMKAKSKVSAEEMMQLTEAGVPAWDYLAKAMGKSTAQVMKFAEQGLIPADYAIRQILAGMNRDFPNMMAVQSRSLLGLWSTIKDTFNMTILTRWGDGLSKAIKPRMERLVDLFTKNEEVAKRWGDTLERVAFGVGNAIMSWLERAFEAVNRRLRDPEFQRLDWSQKISLLLSKAASEAVPKAADLGMRLGANLAVGIGKGALKAAAEDPVTAGVLGLLVGSKVPGPIVVKLAVGLGIGMAPLVSKAGKIIGERIPGTEYFTEKRLAEEEQAARWFKERASLANSMDVGIGLKVKEPLIKGTAIQAYRPTLWERLRRLITPHALGTIATSPHVALVAEEGPESIIPLSSRLRRRALALWQETGRRLGVRQFALGGFTAPPTMLTQPWRPFIAERVSRLADRARDRAQYLVQNVELGLGSPSLGGFPVPLAAGSGGGNVTINLIMDGAVQARVDIGSGQAVEEVADLAAGVLAQKLRRILENTR